MAALPRRTAALAVALLVAFGSSAREASAAWPHPSNVNLKPSTMSNQSAPALVYDPAGAVNITITANNLIDMCRVGVNGTLIEVDWAASTPTAINGPLVLNGQGNLMAFYLTGFYLNVARQTPVGALLGTTTISSFNTDAPVAVASNATGDVICAFRSQHSGIWGIYVQKINASGVVQWSTGGVLLSAASTSAYSPQIAADGNGGAVVTWFDTRNGNYDVFAQAVNSSGVVQWTTGGVAVGSGTGDQWNPAIVADGGGGSIITWHDWRGGNADIYAQRLNASGAAQWTANGVAVCSTSADQVYPVLVSDGLGGAVIAWQDGRNGDGDVYAQRLNSLGAAQWTANGVALCTVAGAQQTPIAIADGLGGAIVAWRDQRAINVDLYAQRVNASGTTLWTTGGAAVNTGFGDASAPCMVTDGSGGAILAWTDSRTNPTTVYMQRVDRWGQLGAEPVLAGVKDVPNDQGGLVKVSWNASPLDTDPLYESISNYYVYRSAPPNTVARALARPGGVITAGAAAEREPGALLQTRFGANTYYWEYLGSVTANHLSTYSYIAPTTGDSVGGSNPRTAYMVEARASGGAQWWYSNADSGYSVDNIAPAAAAPFTGTYAARTARLHWTASSAPDFAQFLLYRGDSPAFVPDGTTLVSAQADTGYVDAAVAPHWYKLVVKDAHGNSSPATSLLPAGTAGVEDGPTHELALSRPSPNPGAGTTTLSFALPRAGRVTLAVFDTQGRRVRTLASGRFPAGVHAVRWDGADESGRRVTSGVFTCRLESEAGTRQQRLVLLR